MKTLLLTIAFALALISNSSAADKKIIFVAGKPSHRSGEHEHRAGSLLIKDCLDQMCCHLPMVYRSPRGAELFGENPKGLSVTSVVYSNGWPTDAKAFDDAATIVVYSDGSGGHPLLQEERLKTFGALMEKGVGLVCIHYAVEPTIEKGQREFLNWIGGAFEVNWSVNPHWDAEFKSLPTHPITRGVKPFTINDEWYFNMRFRDGMKGVTPILTAIPTASTTNRNDGPHENNPAVRQKVAHGEPQHVAWATERADGGRGFGFSGAHFHRNWGNENFRKLVLNAILWTAKVEVPADGVQSSVSEAQLESNLDDKTDRKPPTK